MTISKYLLPFALLLGACDKDESAAPESADAVEVEGAPEHGPRGKLAKLDADKDGAISLAEAKGHRLEHRFAELDADKDGKLSESELVAMKHGGWHGKGRGFGKDPEKRADHLLAKLDADKDGSISQAEVEGSKFAGKFADADADRDGKVTRAELVALKLEHGGFHGKGPGDRGHKDPAEKAAWMLDRFDADKDGSISKAEVEGTHFAEKFADADADKDGKVTRDELVAFKTARAAEHGEGRGKHGEGHRGEGHRGEGHRGGPR